LEVNWLTPDGQLSQILIPLSNIASQNLGDDLKQLASKGLFIYDPKATRDYLAASLDLLNLPKSRGMHKVGFAPATLLDGRLTQCFVLPQETIYANPSQILEPVRLLPHAMSSAQSGYFPSGTLEDWRNYIEETRSNPLQTFAICTALAGPLLTPSQTENGGFHFFGTSSRGKTLSLQLACTVFGSGMAPNQDAKFPTLLNSWQATDNALEVIANTFSDTILVLDEYGLRTDARSPIYKLIEGRGKARMNGSGSLDERMAWSLLMLSSGEIPIHCMSNSKGRDSIQQGQMIRMIDIPIDSLSPSGDAEQAERLKYACGQYFGTAGPAFIRMLLTHFKGDAKGMQEFIVQERDALHEQLCEECQNQGFTLHPHHKRTVRRFALVALAGSWAAEDILPHSEDEVFSAVVTVLTSWLRNQAFESPEDRVADLMRDYVMRFRGQMLVSSIPLSQQRQPLDCHGILHKNLVLFTPNQLQKAGNGLDERVMAATLDKANLLHRNDDQFKCRFANANLRINSRLYAIKLNRLFDESILKDVLELQACGPKRRPRD